MLSLLLVLALVAAGVRADVPLKDDSKTTSNGENQQRYPLTSSEYLKMVFGRHPGVDAAMTPVLLAPESVLQLLPFLGLIKASEIAKRVDLQSILRDSGLSSVTLFAPTDKAIANWKEQVSEEVANDEEVLTRLAKAWIVKKPIRSEALQNEERLPTMADIELRANVFDQPQTAKMIYTVNGASLVDKDQPIGDNFVNSIDKMIFPLQNGNAYETLAKVDDFSVLIDLIKRADMKDFIAETDPLTLLAPVNKAFDLLPADFMSELKTNKTKLTSLLKNHVIRQTYYTARLVDRQTYNLVGKEISVDYDDNKEKFVIKSRSQSALLAEITYPDIPATNGAIQIIDRVLQIESRQ